MCFSAPPAYTPPAYTPPAIQTGVDQSRDAQNAASVKQASGSQQVAAGGGAGSTMLTGGEGVDPSGLALGKKTLLGG